MYDNIHTYYKDTRTFISAATAQSVIAVLKEAEAANKLSAETSAYLSKAYVYENNNKMALHYGLKAIKMNPEYSYGYIRTAFAYARMGDRKNTEKYTQIAEKLNRGQNDYINAFLLVLFKFMGDEQKVKQIFSCIKQTYVEDAEHYFYLGFIYSKEEPEKAIKWFLKAENAGFKDTYNLWTNLADNYSLIEDYEKAELYADKCLNVQDSKIALRVKAEALKEKEDFEEAIRILRRKYKIDGNNEDKLSTLTLLIYCFMYSQNPTRAEKYIKFGFTNFKPDYSFYYVAASYYETILDYDRAINLYHKMTKFETDKASAYASLSFCYSQKGQEEVALKYVNKAIELNSENSYALYRKGRILTNMKKYEEAIEFFLKSVDYDRTDVDCFQWISYCYSVQKNYEKSLEFANRAILLNKEDGYSYFRKAWAYQEMGRYTEALKYYNECIVYDDRYVDAYLNISYIYSKQGNSKQSLLYANKALLINKQYSYAHYRKAWALQECGRYEEACDGYSKAIELEPTDIYNYLGIACISLNNQESSNALLYANKAIFIDRNCGGAYYYKSLALSNLGKTQEAEAAYAKALELGYQP